MFELKNSTTYVDCAPSRTTLVRVEIWTTSIDKSPFGVSYQKKELFACLREGDRPVTDIYGASLLHLFSWNILDEDLGLFLTLEECKNQNLEEVVNLFETREANLLKGSIPTKAV